MRIFKWIAKPLLSEPCVAFQRGENLFRRLLVGTETNSAADFIRPDNQLYQLRVLRLTFTPVLGSTAQYVRLKRDMENLSEKSRVSLRIPPVVTRENDNVVRDGSTRGEFHRDRVHAARGGHPALIQAMSSSCRQRLDRPSRTVGGRLPLASSRQSVLAEIARILATSVAGSSEGRRATSFAVCDHDVE